MPGPSIDRLVDDVLDANPLGSLLQTFEIARRCLFLGGSLREVGEGLAALELGVLDHASISIAGEVARPGDESLAFMLARRDGVCADSRDDGRVRQLWLRRDDAVCDEVIDAGVLLLLDLDRSAVLEGPFDHVGLVGRALDPVALFERRPELAEVLELDEMPDVAEGRLDDGRLADGGGCRDLGRHGGREGAIGSVVFFGCGLNGQ